MAFKVFVRNWYKKDANGNKVPHPNARKTTLGIVSTEQEAREMCKDYNDNNDPRVLSRKAEYTSDY